MQYPQQVPENVKRVWGPAGDGGSSDFYPGNDVVDYVSVAVYALPDKNITDYEKQHTFSSMFIFKTSNIRFINKPILTLYRIVPMRTFFIWVFTLFTFKCYKKHNNC
jgi:beta-mannanase